MATLFAYVRLLIVVVLAMALLLWRLPRGWPWARVVVYIGSFIVARDAMGRVGLWRIAPAELWFTREPIELLGLALLAGMAVVALLVGERELRALVVWKKHSISHGLIFGLAGAAVVLVPVAAWHQLMLHDLVPDVQGAHGETSGFAHAGLLALLVLALVGNLLEELLFRGYVQGLLEQRTTPDNAALLSGLAFGACHLELLIVSSHVGVPFIIFVFWEGLVAAAARRRSGLIASTVAHGLAIFAIGAGYV
jgi:membrane protease YdiL (CAAX protease family)